MLYGQLGKAPSSKRIRMINRIVRITLLTQTPWRVVAFFIEGWKACVENSLRGNGRFLSFVGKSRLRLAGCVGKIFCPSLN